MHRPDWVPAPAWGRLEAALCGDAALLRELTALTETWDTAARLRFLERFCALAERGFPLSAAFIVSVSDLVEADG